MDCPLRGAPFSGELRTIRSTGLRRPVQGVPLQRRCVLEVTDERATPQPRSTTAAAAPSAALLRLFSPARFHHCTCLALDARAGAGWKKCGLQDGERGTGTSQRLGGGWASRADVHSSR